MPATKISKARDLPGGLQRIAFHSRSTPSAATRRMTSLRRPV
jgi:hypothetical protein